MLKRIVYTAFQAWHHRYQLIKFNSSLYQINHIVELTQKQLIQSGVKVLALDFDGVLASHGQIEIEHKIQNWLSQITLPVYILTNKPFAARLAHLKQYSNLKVITHVKKKPYPDGLEKILNETQVQPNEVLLVDDRLLTGMLATCIAGTQGIWVVVPLKNYKDHLIIESGFELLRVCERVGIKILKGLF